MSLTLLLISLTLTPTPDELVVASFQPAALQRFQLPTGKFETDYGASPLTGTLGFDFGPDGMAYVASEGTDEVLRFDPTTGAYLGPFVWDDLDTGVDESGGLVEPSAVAFGPDGLCYVASFSGDSVLRYDGRTGAFIDVFVLPGDGNLDGPDAGMAFGADGDLYIPSFFNHRVKRFDATSGVFVENFLKPSPSGLTNPRQILFHDIYALARNDASVAELRRRVDQLPYPEGQTDGKLISQ
jgi:outer membrane protein assembly factor BamB